MTPFYETTDHKPTMISEKNRLEYYSSMVVNKRVNGVLSTSRALGDAEMKFQGITSDLDIVKFVDVPDWVVVACDGLWDVLSTILVRRCLTEAINNGY